MTAPNPYDTYQGSQQQYSYSTGYNPTQTSATTFVPHQGVAVSYQESTGTTRTTNYNDPPILIGAGVAASIANSKIPKRAHHSLMGTSMTGHIAPSLPQFNGTPAISGNGQRYPPNTIGQSGSSAAVHPSTPFMGLTNQGTAPSPTPLMNNMLRPQMSNFTQVSSGTTQYQQLQIPIVSSGASLAAQYTSPGHQLNFQQAGQPSAHTSEYYQNAQVRSQNQDQQVSADQYNNIQAIAPNYNQLGSGYAQAGGSFHQQINPQSSNFNHPQSSFGHESGGQPSGSYHQVAAQYSQQPIANNQQQSSAYTQSASGQPSGSYAQQPGSYVPQNSYRQQSGSYGQTPAAATSGIDSRQMPRPDQVHALDQKFYESTSYHPDHCSGYPYTWTDYYGYDAGGQSHPRFIRSSLREIPSNQDTLAISGMTPIGLVITPFATLRPEEAAVPLVGDMKMPIRCDKCRAYMNPFCKFIDNGRKFICPLCSATSLIPESYVCALDPSTGRRIDAYQRAELSFGTFDLFAPKEYQTREPKMPSLVFVLDVSVVAIQSGIFQSATKAISAYISRWTDKLPWKVAIVTFDCHVHFYETIKTDKEANDTAISWNTLVIPDVQEPFLPTSASSLLMDDPKLISRLLEILPTVYQNSNITHGALGTALNLAGSILEANGGQILLFQQTLPNYGLGALPPRSDFSSTQNQKSGGATLHPLEPQSSYYKELGGSFASKGISVDLFLLTTSANCTDLASVGLVSSVSGGRMHSYFSFQRDRDTSALMKDLCYTLDNYRAMEAIVRVRLGNGLLLVDHFGSYYPRNATDWEFGKLDSTSTFSMTVDYDSSVKISTLTEIPIQVAILFTDPWTAQRKIRLIHMSIKVTSQIPQLFKAADLDTTLYLMTQSAIASMANVTEQNSVASNSPFGSFLPTRQAIFAKTIKVLAGYRKTCSSHSSSGQLILPETLKLLPLYSLAMTKSKLFRDLGMNTSTALTTDNKVALLRWIKSLDPLTLTTFLYPKLFQLSNNVADSESDFYEESIDGEAALPLYRSLPVTSLSHPLLDFGQVYVLHNGVSLILWIGQQASPAILQDLFSVSSLDQVPSSNSFNPTSLSSMETILARRLVKLQSQLEQKHQRPLPLTLIRHNLDVMVEVPEFVHALIHDKSPLGTDYVDFLCVMHNQIQSYLANL